VINTVGDLAHVCRSAREQIRLSSVAHILKRNRSSIEEAARFIWCNDPARVFSAMNVDPITPDEFLARMMSEISWAPTPDLAGGGVRRVPTATASPGGRLSVSTWRTLIAQLGSEWVAAFKRDMRAGHYSGSPSDTDVDTYWAGIKFDPSNGLVLLETVFNQTWGDPGPAPAGGRLDDLIGSW
jgi:hypothetical protein